MKNLTIGPDVKNRTIVVRLGTTTIEPRPEEEAAEFRRRLLDGTAPKGVEEVRINLGTGRVWTLTAMIDVSEEVSRSLDGWNEVLQFIERTASDTFGA